MRQVYLHNLLSSKLLVVFSLATGAQQLVQCLRMLVDELGKLRILGGDLLEEGLDDGRVLLHHLSGHQLAAT